MFESLKKKFLSFIGSSPKKTSKKEKKTSSSKGSKKKESKKAEKSKKSLTKKEIKLEKEVDKIIEESENIHSPSQESVEEKQNEKEEKGNFFTKLIKKITTSKLSQEDFDDIFSEFEITLLENNVALETVDSIKKALSDSLVGQQIKKQEAEARVLQALKDSVSSILIEPPNLIKQIKEKEGLYTIIFFGINGTGKTTTLAKIAHMLKKNDISSVLVAADTFRAASIEQLKVHANKLSLPVISSQYGSDPASVAFDAQKYASTHKTKVVLIDTAGRMYTKENLMKEMEKIIRVSKPDLKVFVGESITGNDVIDQVKKFNDAVGIDGVILTKSDIDEKGGTILSVGNTTKKPIYFLGTGQSYDDLEVFDPKKVLERLGF